MIKCQDFYDRLRANGVGVFAGVPDSLLKDFCAYIADTCSPNEHVITANEGNAIALAAGYHLATGQIGAVYMQNSGLGNAVNPLASLADREVYKIPMLLVIGWRGEPGVKDEPQHVKQGKITLGQLELLGIPSFVMDAQSNLGDLLDQVFTKLREIKTPVAIVVRKDTFTNYKSIKNNSSERPLTREKAIEEILRLSREDDVFISTTGKTSREVFEVREKNSTPQRDFLTVGGMGHASSIALGVALGKPNKRVVCLDGDGAVLMHMGALPVVSSYKHLRFMHVVLNNECHESVGAQPTAAIGMDFKKLSEAAGYSKFFQVKSLEGIKECLEQSSSVSGPVLIEVIINSLSRDDLARPKTSAEANKLSFMEFLRA